MKGFKVGQEIEVRDDSGAGGGARTVRLVIAAFLAEGILVTAPGAGTHPFPMFVKWENVVMPRAVAGRQYRLNGSDSAGIGLEDGRIYNCALHRVFPFSPEWQEKTVW